MRYYTEGRIAEERKIKRIEEEEHIRRMNGFMSRKEQYERYGNIVSQAWQPGSPVAIEAWNAGKMPVYCIELNHHIRNEKCKDCTTPCKQHARNTATAATPETLTNERTLR